MNKDNSLASSVIEYLNSHSKNKIKSANQITLGNYVEYIYNRAGKNRYSKRLLKKMPTLDISFTEFNNKIAQIESKTLLSGLNPTFNKQKLYFYYWITFTTSQKMLIGVYFKQLQTKKSKTRYYPYYYYNGRDIGHDNDELELYAVLKTKYYDISTDDTLPAEIEESFNMKMTKDIYPIIEYDTNVLLTPIENIFKPYSNSNSLILIKSKNYLYSIDIKKQKHYEMNNANDFIQSQINTQVLENTAFSHYRPEIAKIINENHWKMILSRQEKFLVESHAPFIISGRPGTGKTTVILFKLFSLFFNLQFEKSILKNNEIDWKYITKNLEVNNLREQFRVVFTSLSQDLCDKVQEMYSNMLLQENIDVGYKPIQRKELSTIDSFKDVKTYPLFVSFRKIMFMIDGSLTHQFFSRTSLRKFEQANTDCQIHNKRNMEYLVNNYIDTNEGEEVMNANYLYRSPDLDPKSHTITKKECGIEEFTLFYNDLLKKSNEFKPQSNSKAGSSKNKDSDISIQTQILYRILPNIKKLHLTPAEIYAQIYSVIKGSLHSYLSPLNAITREEYNQKGKKLTDFEEDNEYGFNERDLVYDIFLLYEQHKGKYGLFDIQDFVNHLIRQVRIEFKGISIIDYLFIDEIQDLTVNQIYLLVLVSRYPTVFAGDTCQTISESNRFRFKDLKSLFYFFEQIIPNYPHVEGALLNINYRLNNSLLKLSSFFANIIKLMFPNTVDKFNDEYSVKITPFSPSQLDSIDLLIDIIQEKGNESFQGQNFTFSYYHCFICRDADQAKQLSLKYNDIIFALDIQRCKGLEFEIVIVYNFFSSSKFKELWGNVFKSLDVFPAKNSVQNLGQILKKENLTYIIENIKKFFPNLNSADDNEIIESIMDCHKEFLSCKINMDFNKHLLFEFCAELKQFYVILTRAQTFMMFYEEDPNCSFIEFANTHQLISLNSRELIEQMKTYFNQKELSIADKDTMIGLAEKEFKANNYSKAAYLYKAVNLIEKSIEAEVYDLYEELKRIDITQKDYFMTHNMDMITRINKIKQFFDDPLGIEGQVLTNLGKYEEAIVSYKKNKLIDKCGYIYLYILKDYLNAFEIYRSLNNFKLCVVALESGKLYKKLYSYLSDVNEDIGMVEYSAIYRKYANQYLRSIKLKSCKLKDIALSSFINKSNELTFPQFNGIKGNVNQIITEFLSNYSNMLIKLSPHKNKTDVTPGYTLTPTPTPTPTPSNLLGYESEKDKKTVDDLLKDFSFDTDIQRMINSFFKKDEDSIVLSIIELIPEILYLKSDSFDSINYYALASDGYNKHYHIAKLYTRIKNGIEIICDQAGIDSQLKDKLIKDIALYSNCFKTNDYNTEQNCLISSLLLDEKKLKNIDLSNNATDLTKAVYLNGLFKLFVFNILEAHPIDNDAIKRNVKQLEFGLIKITDTSSHLCENITKVLQNILIQNDYNTIISTFDIIINKFFKRPLQYTFDEYVDLMSHFATISLFIYSSANHPQCFKYNNELCDKNILLALAEKAHIFNEKLLKYSKSNALSNILLFTLFIPFGISYFPKINSVSPIHLYQKINMCLINQNAPLFTSDSNTESYLINEKIKGVFDAKGVNFILKYKTAYKLYKKYHQKVLRDVLLQIIKQIEKDTYANMPNNIIIVSTILPWLYSLSTINQNNKPYNKLNSSHLLQLFKDSIYFPSLQKEASPSIIFHSLLHILLLNKENSQQCIQNTSTLVFYLCYQMKSKLSNSTRYDSKLNLYLLLTILYDSYGIVYKNIEGRFIFEDDKMDNLLFYNHPSLWLEVLSLLNQIEFSPMIALIWIKKLTYQLIAWIQKTLLLQSNNSNESIYVYDINEVLTTSEMFTHQIKNKKQLNDAISKYFTTLNYFISNFRSNKQKANEFEIQFYEMNIYCVFLSFLGLIKRCKNNKEQIDVTLIEAFVDKYKKDNIYSQSIKESNDDTVLLESPLFALNVNNVKSEVVLIKRNTKDLFTKLPQMTEVTEFKIALRSHSNSLWNQPFDLDSKGEMNKFVLNKYNNEITYGEALLAIKKKYSIENAGTIPKVVNDECAFSDKSIEDNEQNYQEDNANKDDGDYNNNTQIHQGINYYLDVDDDKDKIEKKKKSKKTKIVEEDR